MSQEQVKTIPDSFIKLKDIHSSWIQELPYGTLLDKLRKKTIYNEGKLLMYISKYVPIENVNLASDKGYLYKLHNIKPKELERLILKAGVSQFSTSIKQVINQQDVKKIKQLLGDNLYQFALHEAHKEPPVALEQLNNNELFKQSLSPYIEAGIHTLDVVLQGHSNNCFLKLPKSWKEEYTSKKSEEIDLREQRLQKKLLSNLI